MKIYTAIPASDGFAYGTMVQLIKPSPRAASRTSLLNRSKEQRLLFLEIRQKFVEECQELYQSALRRISSSGAMIFLVHQKIAEDICFEQEVLERIQKDYPALQAVQTVLEGYIRQISHLEDDYLRQRADDIREVLNRMEQLFLQQERMDFSPYSNVILGVTSINASDLLLLDRTKIKAILCQEGTASSHSSIVARELGIPMVVGMKNLLEEIPEGSSVQIDGAAGEVFVNPTPKQRRLLAQRQAAAQAEQEAEAVTPLFIQNHRILCLADVSSPTDAAAAYSRGMEGIGLFRSEFLVLHKNRFPTEEEQVSAYRKIIKEAQGLPVTIRVFDLGNDKLPNNSLPPEFQEEELNPALGCRGIRFMLAHPELLIVQLRALLRAANNEKLSILLPLVTNPEEIIEVKKLLEEAKSQLEQREFGYGSYRLGAMVETPAAALTAGSLARECDFIQIGYNDLTQYTLAVDRCGSMSSLYDFAHPGVLALARAAIEGTQKEGKPVILCGDAAGKPDLALQYARMGVDGLCIRRERLSGIRQVLGSAADASPCPTLQRAL